MKLFKSVNLDLINVHLDSCVMEATSYKLPASALGRDSNLMSASCLVSELTVSELTCQRVVLSASCPVSELTVSELVCQRVVLSAS